MNKFAAIVLCAVVACSMVAAQSNSSHIEEELESQMSLNPSDEEETASLSGPTQIFSDFCIKSRDFVIGDIKQNSNDAASAVFSLFFNSAEKLGLEALATERQATEKLANQIRNPGAEIAAPGSSDADQIIYDGQVRVQNAQIQPQSIFQAVTATLKATGTQLADNVMARLNFMRNNLGLHTITSVLTEACEKINSLEDRLKVDFEAFKQPLASSSPVSGLQLENVPCLTSRRIMRLQALCAFARNTQAPLMKMLIR